MNSVLEYIRQLNHESVRLRDEWLDRLRHVECDSTERGLTPEVVVDPGSTVKLSTRPAHSPEPPVTTVQRPFVEKRVSELQALPRELSVPTSSATMTGKPVFPVVDTWQDLDELLREVTGESSLPAISDDDLTEIVRASRPSSTGKPATLPPAATESVAGVHVMEPESEAELPYEIMDSSPEWGHSTTHFQTPTRIANREPGVDVAQSDEESDALPGPATAPRSIERIVDRILDRFPTGVPVTLMFAATNSTINVDGLAVRVVEALANRETGKLLLVDGNSGSRRLSATMGAPRNTGLTETINRGIALNESSIATDNGRLDFLPFGTGEVTHRKLGHARAAGLNRQFQQSYDLTLVSGGPIHENLAWSWAPFVDGLYLLVDLDRGDRDETRRVVEQLRHRAVRLAGCIAIRSVD